MASNRGDDLQTALAIEARLNLAFHDKSLLLRALTHRSYLNESSLLQTDNERLEFLGDAILDLVVAELLYQRFPEQHEGALTAMRAQLVRRETLAQLARQIGLPQHLLLGRGEEESGGRDRDALLCATFEALCGAMYLDLGAPQVAAFLMPLIESELTALRQGQHQKDPKSQLQEWSQAELNATPRYVTISTEGPDHAKEFTVEVRIGSEVFGVGRGNSKQRAAQAAAQAALAAHADWEV